MRETVYKKMYTTLFNAVTDALERMEDEDFLAAQELLRRAQQAGEELFLEEGEKWEGGGVPRREGPGGGRKFFSPPLHGNGQKTGRGGGDRRTPAQRGAVRPLEDRFSRA